MTIPFFDISRQHAQIENQLIEAASRVIRSGRYILGSEVEQFEQDCVLFLGGGLHALAVSSGTDSLLLALMALEIGPGDEVIVPSFTFFATAGCVSRVGATPVFADSCPISFNLDPADVVRRISKRTKAIIPVHLFGQAADMDEIMAVAKDHGLKVIEDAAQAFGATYKGQAVGTLGDFGTYSFYPTKNLGALGDAGLLVTKTSDLARRAEILRVHGMEPKYHHQFIGGNFRLDALQTALLRVKLPHLSEWNLKRCEKARIYIDALSPVADLPTNIDSVVGRGALGGGSCLPGILPDRSHIWNQFTIQVGCAGARTRLREYLASQGIGTDIYYPIPLHRQACFAHLPVPVAPLPVAEYLANNVLSLPIFPELTKVEQSRIVEAISDFYRQP